MAELSSLSSIPPTPEQSLYRSSSFQAFKNKVAALAMAMGMLPILAVGSALYYFGDQSIEQQITAAKRAGATQLAATTLTQQKERLAILLLGTGATALLSGAIAAVWTNRTLRSAMTVATAVNAEAARQTRTEVEQQFKEAIYAIRRGANQADILKAAVEEVRKAINSDRLIVYVFDQEGVGTVLAESVAPNWPKALRAKIADPCFSSQYIEAYRRGRVKATEDIYAAGLTPCHISQLEAFAVRANLAAPILNGDHLFGLLIAHQCSRPRVWRQFEIDFFTQATDQVGIALDNANFQIQTTSEAKIAQAFREEIHHIYESLTENDILKAAVEACRKMIAVDRVIVCALDPNVGGVVITESVVAGWPKTLKMPIKDPYFGAQPDEAYRLGQVKALEDIYAAELGQSYIEQLEACAVKAQLIAPILKQGEVFGLLIAHQCSGPRSWQAFEIRWFAQLSTQVGFALNTAKLLAEKNALQKEAEHEIEWKAFFTDATRQIHASLSREDVLKSAVEEARRVLACDRVLIYSVDRESKGIVIAESVGPDWPKALGRTIEDPCFEARYIKTYENGRVRALNNIYEAGMTQCYIDQLEVLAVKANLVAPVLHEGKLLGIMVAHQCSGPRVWKSLEIGWFTQIAVQVGYALDNAKLVGRVNQMVEDAALEVQWKAFFTDATRQIHASLSREDVLNSAVEEVRRVLTCDRVLVYSVDRESKGIVIAESVGSIWPKAFGITIEDPCFEARYIEKFENGRVRALNNIYEGGMTQCYIDQLEILAVKANLVAPVLHEGKLLGLLVAHQCSGPRVWKPLEIDWFTQIAVQVGYALDNANLIGRVNQMSLEAEIQQQVSALLKDSEAALEDLSDEARRQTETVAAAIAHIQIVTESAQEMVTTAHQAELQIQQTDQTVQVGHELISQTVDNISILQETVMAAAAKSKHLGLSAHKIAQTLTLINDLAIQMNQQVMNVAITAGRAGEGSQVSVLPVAEAVRSLSQQLAETTAATEPLAAEIEAEAKVLTADMEAGTEQVFTETELTQKTQNKLDEIAAVSAKMSMLVGKIAQAAVGQVQTSTAASRTALEIAHFANHTSEQSTAVVKSLTTLALADSESPTTALNPSQAKVSPKPLAEKG